MFRLAIPALVAVIMVASSGAVSAMDAPASLPSKVMQVRLGSLEAVEEVSGAVTFALTDSSGETQSVTREFQAESGEPLGDLEASFTYMGPFQWSILVNDDDGRQLTFLEGDYPGYPYSVAAPLSNRLRVADPEQSIVFLDLISFMLKFDAIAVLREETGLERVHATVGLDSDGSGDFDPDEVVKTVAKPESRLVRVSVPRLSSTVKVASFFISLSSHEGQQLANLEGTWSFDDGESVAFDLEASQMRDIAAFYGKPQPSQSIATMALPNPWHLKRASFTSANQGADFSFLIGQELHLLWEEIGRSSPPETTQPLITVTTEEGDVVEGATIRVSDGEYITDEFGQATIFAPPGFHEAVITAEGLESDSIDLEFVDGETFSTQVMLYRPGPGPLDRTNNFLDDYWLALVFGIGVVVALALLAAVILIPSSRPQRVRW